MLYAERRFALERGSSSRGILLGSSIYVLGHGL